MKGIMFCKFEYLVNLFYKYPFYFNFNKLPIGEPFMNLLQKYTL